MINVPFFFHELFKHSRTNAIHLDLFLYYFSGSLVLFLHFLHNIFAAFTLAYSTK